MLSAWRSDATYFCSRLLRISASALVAASIFAPFAQGANAGELKVASPSQPAGFRSAGMKVAMARGPIDHIDWREEGARPGPSRTTEMAYVCSLSGAGQTTSCSLRRVAPNVD